MNFKDAVKSIWHHSEGALYDEAALLKEIVRYATLSASSFRTLPVSCIQPAWLLDRNYGIPLHGISSSLFG